MDVAPPVSAVAGVRIASAPSLVTLQTWLDAHGLADVVDRVDDGHGLRLALQPHAAAAWTPGHDTLELTRTLGLDTLADDTALDREILIALLAAPVPLAFDSLDELQASVRVRRRIARAAARTSLAFDTQAAERPQEDWVYDEQHGFLLRPGRDLIAALGRATQPPPGGQRYDFSCYRATEYVILLGIAQELRHSHPALLERLERQCQRHAIRSALFHEVFLHEVGSMEAPLPPRWLVPGDRVWFRNPDARSADITGYEGSWVVYLGSGLFSNFWQSERPYTLAAKALEIHHWRHGVVGPEDAAAMDEALVARHVAATLDDPASLARILQAMLRLRDPKGVYQDGGCLDTTREYPRQLCPGTADLRLPDA